MFIVIGGSGYLGSYLIKNIIDNTDSDIIATHSTTSENRNNYNGRVKWVKLDIASSIDVDYFCTAYLTKNIHYDIIYLAAYHHPDKVEENRNIAWNINVSSLDYFLDKAKTKIKSLYYASTDSVYGESIENQVFSEDDYCNPINTYGRTKFIAEQIVIMHGFSVLRYSLLMGPSLIAKQHFFDTIVNSLKNNNSIDMFSDSYRSVISFELAAELTIKLLLSHYKPKDILNISGDIAISKYDIAFGIAQNLNLDHKYLNKVSILTNNNFASKRAQNTLISNKKIKNVLKIPKIEYDFK